MFFHRIADAHKHRAFLAADAVRDRGAVLFFAQIQPHSFAALILAERGIRADLCDRRKMRLRFGALLFSYDVRYDKHALRQAIGKANQSLFVDQQAEQQQKRIAHDLANQPGKPNQRAKIGNNQDDEPCAEKGGSENHPVAAEYFSDRLRELGIGLLSLFFHVYYYSVRVRKGQPKQSILMKSKEMLDYFKLITDNRKYSNLQSVMDLQ